MLKDVESPSQAVIQHQAWQLPLLWGQDWTLYKKMQVKKGAMRLI